MKFTTSWLLPILVIGISLNHPCVWCWSLFYTSIRIYVVFYFYNLLQQNVGSSLL